MFKIPKEIIRKYYFLRIKCIIDKHAHTNIEREAGGKKGVKERERKRGRGRWKERERKIEKGRRGEVRERACDHTESNLNLLICLPS